MVDHLHAHEAAPSRFAFEVTFPREGNYVLFAVVAPRGERKTIRSEIVVGTPRPSEAGALKVSASEQRHGPYRVQLATDPATPRAGEWTTLSFRLTRDGLPVSDLHEGADSGHLVIIDSSTTQFVYAHSTDGEATGGVRAKAHLPALPISVSPAPHDSRRTGTQFHAFFSEPGLYKVWAEIAPGSDHITADFVVEVADTKGTVP